MSSKYISAKSNRAAVMFAAVASGKSVCGPDGTAHEDIVETLRRDGKWDVTVGKGLVYQLQTDKQYGVITVFGTLIGAEDKSLFFNVDELNVKRGSCVHG